MKRHLILLLGAWFALPVHSASAAEPVLSLDLGDGVRMELVLVKSGKFQQGSPATEKGRNDDETPRSVTLSHDFYLGKYPVTKGQFARFVRETGYRTEAERGPSGGFGFDGKALVQRKEFTWRNPGFAQTDDHPVTIVTFNDAKAFLDWLSKKAHRRCELPTEAQWEFACRAGTTTSYYSGETETDADAIAWFKTNAGNGTRPVGQKKANALGLFEMNGNVHQWCKDWYGPYAAGPVNDPEGAEPANADPRRRVLRGGSWLREARHTRSAARYRNDPASRNADNGFRVLAAVEPDSPVQATPNVTVVPKHVVTPVQPSHESRTSYNAGTIATVAVVISVVLFLFWAARRLGRASAGQDASAIYTQPTGPRNVRWRLGKDGFWIATTSVPRGSVIRYRCRVAGQERSGQVSYEPGPQGHFVYTGGTPTAIEIIDVSPPPGSGDVYNDPYMQSAYTPTPSPQPRHYTPPRHDPTPPSTGYPSAY